MNSCCSWEIFFSLTGKLKMLPSSTHWTILSTQTPSLVPLSPLSSALWLLSASLAGRAVGKRLLLYPGVQQSVPESRKREKRSWGQGPRGREEKKTWGLRERAWKGKLKMPRQRNKDIESNHHPLRPWRYIYFSLSSFQCKNT